MSQLEPQLRAILRARIKDYLIQNRMTTIFVTHDQTEAIALADRIAVMEKGVLQQYAHPADLKERPANLFVASFIGEPPMNIVDAIALEEGGRRWLQILDPAGNPAFRVALTGQASALPAHGGLEPGVKYALGIRPHRLRIGAAGTAGADGAESSRGNGWAIRPISGWSSPAAPSSPLPMDWCRSRSGEQIPLALPLGALHLFDRATGTALRHGLDAETKAA